MDPERRKLLRIQPAKSGWAKATAMQDKPGILIVYTVGTIVLLAYAAWRDVATRTIPDTVSIALVVLGAATRLAHGWEPFVTSMLVAIALFLLMLPFCSRGLIGGADLKLLAALATGLSPLTSLHLVADVTIVGGALAISYLVLDKMLFALNGSRQPKGRASPLFSRIVKVEFWRIRRRSPLPYGIAIAVGATFAVLNQQGI